MYGCDDRGRRCHVHEGHRDSEAKPGAGLQRDAGKTLLVTGREIGLTPASRTGVPANPSRQGDNAIDGWMESAQTKPIPLDPCEFAYSLDGAGHQAVGLGTQSGISGNGPSSPMGILCSSASHGPSVPLGHRIPSASGSFVGPYAIE